MVHVAVGMNITISRESVTPVIRVITQFYIYPEKNEIHINNMYDFTTEYVNIENWLLSQGATMIPGLVWGTKWIVTDAVILLFSLRWS